MHTFAISMTWVRAPGLYYVHIIFPIIFLCRHNLKDYHTPQESLLPRVQLLQIKGSRLMNTINASQHVSRPSGKSNRPRVFGPDYSKSYLQFGTTPPGLQFSIFFSCFIFNCYFVLFICLN